MNRKKFLHTSSATAILGLIPLSFWGSFFQQFTLEELTGKTEANLYGKNHQLRKEVNGAFLSMQAAAKKEGIDIQIVSAYRSYERQKQIYNSKFRRYTQQGLTETQAIEKIIEYSTIPGTSRHHWGTDIDIIDAKPPQPKSVLLPKNYEEGGVYCNMKVWLNEHSKKFGFYIAYTNNPNRKGFYPEPWHFSYKAIALPMLEAYKQIDIHKIITQDKGLLGKNALTEVFINKYKNENILDINPDLLP